MSSDSSGKRKRRPFRLGKYQVQAHIASGGMGAVYKAKDVELGREVALKILPHDLADKPGMLERFKREARSAARLRHENIVTLYELGEEQGTHFIALEFIKGIDLHDYIQKKGKLDAEVACEVTRQAALALEHANKHGLVHRDIKPSNFLLTRKGRKLLVKMTDFGLAREHEADEDEASRITRAGTTVGTVDYISPEQARDSGSADIRSDIYSLGCTLYHMLTGRPPFPEGSMNERLFKHIGEEPEDVGRLNPQVPDALRAVLRRMMAKKPEERYQTPAELLRDLAKVDPHARPVENRLEALASLAEMEEVPRPRRKPGSTADDKRPSSSGSQRKVAADKRPSSSAQRRAADRPPSDDDEDEEETRGRAPGWSSPAGPYRRARGSGTINRVGPTEDELTGKPVIFGREVSPALLVAGVIGLCIVIAGATLFIVLNMGSSRPPKPPPTHSAAVIPPPPPTEPQRLVETHPAHKPEPPPEPAGPPRLFTSAADIDAPRLREQMEAPWAGDAEPGADTPVFAVSRVGLLAGGGAKGEVPGGLAGSSSPTAAPYASLADACAAAPVGRTSIIEVRDNGPLFLGPASVNGRSLVLRAGKGYRPLVVWDPGAAHADGGSLLSVTQGNLAVEGLCVAVRWRGDEAGCLFRVTGGDFLARDCVFSAAGARGGVSIIRLEGDSTEGPGPRCRLSRCFGRGGSLVGLDVRASGARVLVDDCLLVGGAAPLLQVRAASTRASTLGIARSTLVGRETFLQVGPAAAGDRSPALDCTIWDSILARSNRESGGDLVALAGGATTTAMRWRAANCVYAGWANLLGGMAPVPATDLAAWHGVWGQTEVDKALREAWPAGEVHDPAEVLPGPYNPDGSPVGYAASAGSGLIGCPVAALPPARENWLALTCERFTAPAVDYLGPAAVPPPADNGGPFAGARLDLNQTDLGAYLEQMAHSRGLAPQVVLYLQGSGERKTHPVRVKGSSLVLVFESPADKAEPLTLVPSDTGAGQNALFEVEDGNLDLVGANIRFPDFKTALVPAYLLAVRGGRLRLHGCRLQGPLAHPPDSYQALVRFDGSGKADADGAHVCAVDDSVLLSGRDGIEVAGTGARVGVQQSLVVCGQDALHFQPGETTEARLNVLASLNGVTVAARRVVVRQDDAPGVALPLMPVLVQSAGCAFLNPFVADGNPARAGLLLAAGGALPRGLLVWQSDGDLYDKRLYFQAAADGQPPERPQPPAAWARLWGPANDSKPILDQPLKGTIDLERPQLERLALPPLTRHQDRPPGADLARLGISRKK